jgi:PAS domain S-box-containing protein
MDMTSSLTQKFTELKTANDHLEQRVAARTVELTQVNDKLCVEINERVIAEEELFQAKEHLEENVRQRTADLLTVNGALQKEIAKHRHTEECLASEKEMLSVTLQGIGDGVISTDTQGNVVLMNKVAEELTGWAQQEMVGRPLPGMFKTIGDTNSRKGLTLLRNESASGIGGVVTDNALLRSRDGAEYFISSSYAPIKAGDGNIIGGVLVFRDNTEKKKIEEKLSNAQKLESIGVLAGGIAHDFNNLLSAIIGNISLARAKRDYSSFERLEDIEEACKRAIGLTQQLLTFSKGGSPVRKSTSIVDLIKQSSIFVTRGSNVRCEFHFARDLWPVYADEGQLNQVINNLVINARQAMPDGGIIRISAENVLAGPTSEGAVSAGNRVKVSVGDAGPGIPPEDVSKIFDPYFTTKEHGSGLGLATIYSIVTRHGGKIDVETEVGSGTTFHVYLPVSDKPLEDAVPSAANSPNGKGKILVMDDEKSIRDIAGKMLAHLGYEVTCARDGAEAIDLYKLSIACGKPFDVVIMDLTVPGGMGGKDAMAILKQVDSGIVAIVSSGYSNDPIMADPGKFGFSGVVAKPYTLNSLSNAVHGVLDSPGGPFRKPSTDFALVSNGY